MRLRNEGEGPPYRFDHSQIAEAGYNRIVCTYPRYSEIFYDLVDQLEHDPHNAGLPFRIDSAKERDFFLTGTPRVRHAPATRLLYEVLEIKKRVIVWSVSQKE